MSDSFTPGSFASVFPQATALVQEQLSRPSPVDSVPDDQKRVASAIALGVWIAPRGSHPARSWVQAWGHSILTPEVKPVSVSHYFDLASLSKVLSTATLVARLVDQGRLQWWTPVQRILSDFPDERVTVAHLLSHTSGLPAWAPFYEWLRTRGAALCSSGIEGISRNQRQTWMREELARFEPEVEPGHRVLYSDLSFLWLGFLTEEVLGLRLEQAARRWVWDALGLSQDGLHYRTKRPRPAERSRYVATENCPWRHEVLQGLVHDDNCYTMGGVGGHAGVFGRVQDVLDFGAALLLGNAISPATKRAMWSRVPYPPGCERTLGWDTPASHLSSSAGSQFSRWTVGHLGFTGTSLWMDLQHGVVMTVLTNRVHPTREGGSRERIGAFRPQVHDALWKDLVRQSELRVPPRILI